MIGLFQLPRLLIGTSEKVAIERELVTLSSFFGSVESRSGELMRPEDLEAIQGNREEVVNQLFHCIADLLELNTEKIRLVYTRADLDCVSGMYWVHNSDNSLTKDGTLVEGFQSDLMIGANLRLESIVAEMVRLLVAEKLIFAAYADAGDPDLSFIAEVATVYFGFGLFTVNETVSCTQCMDSGSHHFSMVKLGALNSFGNGYLLALVLWLRNQIEPGVENRLRPDAALSFQKTVEYLEKTNDSLLCDPNLARVDASTSISTIEAQLKTGTPTTLLWLLESIQHRNELERDVTLIQSSLFELTRHRDNAIAKVALHLISLAERLDATEIKHLQRIARGRDLWMSAVASNVLSGHLPFNKCENEFSRLLERIDHDAAANAAQMAHRFGSEAIRYERQVCQRIKAALNRCNYGLGFWYMLILTQISGDAEKQIADYFGADEDLMRGARELFQEAVASTNVNFNEQETRPSEINDVFAIPAWMSL